MMLKRTEPGLAFQGRVMFTWEDLLRMADYAVDDVDHAAYSVRDAERLERIAAFIRRIVAARETGKP